MGKRQMKHDNISLLTFFPFSFTNDLWLILRLLIYSPSISARLRFSHSPSQQPITNLTPWNSVFLEKLTVTQLNKKLILCIYGTWRFITIFDYILNQMHPVHTFTPYFSKIHFKIILQSTCKFSRYCSPISLDLMTIFVLWNVVFRVVGVARPFL